MKKIKDIILLLMGTFLIAIAINVFFVPNNISSGGASGLAIIINHIWNFPVGIAVLILNLPLFIVSILKINFRFTFKALLGTLLLSIFIGITSQFGKYEIFSVGGDYILSSIFGGVIMGLGISLVFKGKASTGGSELLAQIVYKYRPIISTSQIMLIIDSFVVILSAIAFNSLKAGLYAIIAIFVSKKTIDVVFEGINYTKIINIITKKPESISKRILEEIERGVTTIDCIGEYTKENYTKIECVATITQIYRIKDIIKQEDTEAFMYIASSTEVLGYGFEK